MTHSLITVNSGTPTERQYTFSLGCPDHTGIVSTPPASLSDIGAWITKADSFLDPEAGWFFTRQTVHADTLDLTVEELCKKFAELVDDWGPEVRWKVTDNAVPERTVILATKGGHYLQDLLGRVVQSDYPMEIVVIIDNHRDLGSLIAAYNIPFHHALFPKDTVDKRKVFDEIDEIVGTENPDAIVLAHFTRILPPDLCEKWEGHAINIHHSFLPSFIGARPYPQAYRRGVKPIGVICHYATEDLDDGPIIEQDVMCVPHKYTAADMQRGDRDTKKQVLARGLYWHLEDRVQVYDNRIMVFQQITVVFQQAFREPDLSDKAGRAYATKKASLVDSGSECITTFDQEE